MGLEKTLSISHMVITQNMMSNNRNMLEEIENHQDDDHVTMMMELGKELETLKRKIAEEIDALRMENARIR